MQFFELQRLLISQDQLVLGAKVVAVAPLLPLWLETILVIVMAGNLLSTIVAWGNYAGAKDLERKAIDARNEEDRRFNRARRLFWAPRFFISPFVGTLYWILIFMRHMFITGSGSVGSMARDTLSSKVKEKSPGQLSVASKEGGQLSRSE